MSIAKSRNDQNLQAHRLGFWGPTGAGKTVYLSKLYHDNSSSAQGWHATAADHETDEFLKSMREKLEIEGQLPSATMPESPPTSIQLHLSENAQHRATIELQDRPGSDFKLLPSKVRNHLADEVAGMVLLLDQSTSNLIKTLEDTFSALALQRNKHQPQIKEQRPLALCLAKSDAYISEYAEYVEAKDNPTKFVEKNLHPKVRTLIEKYCANYKLFPISSTGLDINHGSIKPTLYFDESFQTRILKNSQPINLLAPFIWLLEQLDNQG